MIRRKVWSADPPVMPVRGPARSSTGWYSSICRSLWRSCWPSRRIGHIGGAYAHRCRTLCPGAHIFEYAAGHVPRRSDWHVYQAVRLPLLLISTTATAMLQRLSAPLGPPLCRPRTPCSSQPLQRRLLGNNLAVTQRSTWQLLLVKSSSTDEPFSVTDSEAERFNQIAAALVAKYKDLPEPEGEESGKQQPSQMCRQRHVLHANVSEL